jgi:hypothetical protein
MGFHRHRGLFSEEQTLKTQQQNDRNVIIPTLFSLLLYLHGLVAILSMEYFSSFQPQLFKQKIKNKSKKMKIRLVASNFWN